MSNHIHEFKPSRTIAHVRTLARSGDTEIFEVCYECGSYRWMTEEVVLDMKRGQNIDARKSTEAERAYYCSVVYGTAVTG